MLLAVPYWQGAFFTSFCNGNTFPRSCQAITDSAVHQIVGATKVPSLVTPLIALIIFCGITVTERFPQIWNTGVKVTEENRERVYSVLHHMISTIKFFVFGNTYLNLRNRIFGKTNSPMVPAAFTTPSIWFHGFLLDKII